MEKPLLIKSPVYQDFRGTFSPTEIRFGHRNHLFVRKDWCQTNVSINPNPHTFRGLHFQDPVPQSKLIKVIQGEIIDFGINLKTGDTQMWKISPGDAIYIPKGYAHGFVTLIENTIVQYLVDEDYRPEFEHSIDWRSISGVYDILKDMNLCISEKDNTAISYEDYLKRNKDSEQTESSYKIKRTENDRSN